MTFISESALAAKAVLVGDYQVQIFTEPDPLVVEKDANLIIKIQQSRDKRPVRNGQIYLSTRSNFQAAETDDRNFKILLGYKAAIEADEFGNYELRTNFKEAGAYYIKVAIKGLGGKTFHEPLTAGFTVRVKASVSSGFKLLFFLSAVFIITLVGVYLIYRRNRIPRVKSIGFNLLEIEWIKWILQSKYIQPVFQIPLLAAFILLLILSFVDIQDSGKNLAVIVIWTLWWTGIIFTFVLVGRLWCFMCPVGAISEWTSRIFKSRR